MDYIDTKYVNLISSRLRNFTRKSSELYNFSCVFCGDSKEAKKARGYVYIKQGKTLFHCHNCSVTMGFHNFLKTFDFQLYSEYNLEKYKDSKPIEQVKQEAELQDFISKMKKPIFMQSGPLKGLKKISQLKSDHPCKIFVDNRQIPNPFHAKMFYCPNYMHWVNEIIPGKFRDEILLYDEPRLLIPFFDKEKYMHAFQGRSLDPNSDMRYITIVNDDSKPKVYGMDVVDFNKKYYVFEGPIDSMFVANSIATAGGDLVSTVKDLPKKNAVVVYDNEPRSKETKQKLDRAIINGYKVCVWPTNLEHKDVNDMILAGLSADFIRYIIDQNTYHDLRAKLALNMWSKV